MADAADDDVTLDPETEQRIEEPISPEAVRETRLTPAEAVAGMKISVPARGNRKLRRLLELVNDDDQLKAWWHVSNVNAVVRLQINDHSWVHIQIVTNIALKLLRQLTKHNVETSLVRDYGLSEDDAEVAVVLAALFHMSACPSTAEGTRTSASSSPSRSCASCSTRSTTSRSSP